MVAENPFSKCFKISVRRVVFIMFLVHRMYVVAYTVVPTGGTLLLIMYIKTWLGFSVCNLVLFK